MDVRIAVVESMPFAENTYVVWRPDRADAVVIDPGFEPDAVLDVLRENGLTAAVILNTHGHVDHIAGNEALKAAFPAAPLVIGGGDAAMLTDPMLNLSGLAGAAVTSPPADRTVREGDVVEAAGLRLEVLDIPGHSPGHVAFVVRDRPQVVVFGGDVLFAGSIGRTDFPGGDLELLLGGIRAKLWPLPDDTAVYPGHGPVTTVGEERRTNPFLTGGVPSG
ncbi:MAG TPA: MBL fold metallo-hydrolase [Gemmataceae bacterium]|jgi:glyoxylase-like metal-dependent hydrolase (beta-lactamase superfamily II)